MHAARLHAVYQLEQVERAGASVAGMDVYGDVAGGADGVGADEGGASAGVQNAAVDAGSSTMLRSWQHGMARLSASERRTVTRLVSGVTRRRRALDYAAAALLTGRELRNLAPPLRQCLQLGLHELVEAHQAGDGAASARATVYELVEVASASAAGARSGALVNAVLRAAERQLAAEGALPAPAPPSTAAAAALAAPSAPHSPAAVADGDAAPDAALVEWLGVTHSHPDWLVARHVAQLGAADAAALLAANNEAPQFGVRSTLAGQARTADGGVAGTDVAAMLTSDLEAALAEAAEREDSAALGDAAATSGGETKAEEGEDANAANQLEEVASATGTEADAAMRRAAQRGGDVSGGTDATLAVNSSALTPGFARVSTGLQAISRAGLLASGQWAVQDEAAGLVVHAALAPRPGDRVLDACAAPGGKALLAAALMQGEGLVVAADKSAHKVEAMQQAAKLQGASSCVTCVAAAAEELQGALQDEGLPIAFDKVRSRHPIARGSERAFVSSSLRAHEKGRRAIAGGRCLSLTRAPNVRAFASQVLVDAPCSGMGVARKRPDLRWTRKESDLEGLLGVQRTILDAAAARVAPGGVLVYSTCSVDAEENAAQAKAFLDRHAGDFEVEKVRACARPRALESRRVCVLAADTRRAFARV